MCEAKLQYEKHCEFVILDNDTWIICILRVLNARIPINCSIFIQVPSLDPKIVPGNLQSGRPPKLDLRFPIIPA